MPQGLTVPAWYNDDHYISEKVDECNTIKFGAVEGEEFTPWTEASVRDFMAAANNEASYASWMGYDNFVSNGNAENCSPSQYFVVSEYLAAKAAQLNEIQYEDKTDWDQAKVLDAFRAANISAWDHYTTTGQQEGINPSNAFDNDAFFTAKCAILNAWQNEDGTVGYEGKDDWTKDDVIAVFQSLGINPIMNQPENPDAASLIIAVPADEQVSGGNFNPWGPTSPTEYNDIPLVAGEHEYIGTDGNDNFIGDVTGSSSKSTLQRDDVIDGAGGDDMLTVDLNGNWSGFSSKGGMTNVGTVNLENDASRAYSFNAKGIDGATTWNLDGNINLSELSRTGVDVNLSNVHIANGVNIGFASGVTSGPADALTIGLENVYIPATGNDQSAKPVSIKAQGIEDVTINSTGTLADNRVDISNIDYMETLAVKGDGNVHVTTSGKFFDALNASDATGNVAVTASGSVLDNIQLGSGNDRVYNNVAQDAVIDGGDGEDAVYLTGANGPYALSTTNLETVGINGNSGKVTLIGAEMDGVENLTLSGTANFNNGGVVLGEFANSALNVRAEHSNSADLTIADISDISLTVGDGKRGTSDNFTGNLKLDASSLSITTEDVSQPNQVIFDSAVDADNVTDLSLNAGRNSSLTVKGGDLSQVSSLTAAGYGLIDLKAASALGTEAQNVYVDTTQMSNGKFTASFVDNNTTGAVFNLVGSNLADHNIKVGTSYDSITVSTGMGADTVEVVAEDGVALDISNMDVDLGGGNNGVIINGQVANGWDFSAWKGVSRISFAPNSGISQADQAAIAGQLGISVDNVIVNSQDSGTKDNPIQLPSSVLEGGFPVTVPAGDYYQANASGLSELDFSEVTINNGGAFVAENVGATVTAELPPDGGMVILQSKEGTPAQDWTVNASGSQGNEIFVNMGAPTAGNSQTLTINHTGDGDLTLNTDNSNNTKVGSGTVDVTDFTNTVLELNTSANAGTTTTVGGMTLVPGGTSQVATTRFKDLQQATITGGSDVNLKAQLGGKNVANLQVDAGDATGDLDISMVAAQTITYTGSQGDDALWISPYASGSQISLGAGADKIAINSSWMAVADGARPGVINLDLGSGSGDGDDQVEIYPAGSSNPALLMVTNFNSGDSFTLKDDIISGQVADLDNVFGVKYTEKGKLAGLINAFTGSTIDDSAVTLSQDGGVVYTTANGVTTAWFTVIKGESVGSNVEGAVSGQNVVLVGVQGSAVQSGDGIDTYGDWSVAAPSE